MESRLVVTPMSGGRVEWGEWGVTANGAEVSF